MSALDTPGVDTLLARILWERGVVELRDLQDTLQATRRGQGTLARQLVTRGLARADELEQVLSESLGVQALAARRVGPYLLGERLGEGGMGIVWLGVHETSGAEVAVKTLSATSDPEFRARFVREGEAQARVDAHPNVVRVHSAGSEGGTLYLVLDYAPGGDLSARLATQGRLPAREAAEIARDLARGLAHVHAAGVLHRDLKPQNVLFGEDGRPRLVDFGLARLEGRTALTESGVVLGTPAYMAPEQAMGQRETIGPATDVYGLGALLYAVLTGHPPFAAATLLGVLDQVLTRAPEPPGVDPGLDAICLRCLEKDPADRYATAEELAEALEAWLAGEAVAGRPSRRRVGLALGLIATLAVVGGGLLALTFAFARADLDPSPAKTIRIDRLQRGVEASEEGDWRTALRHFEDALAEQPGALEIRLWRGRALRGLGRREEALPDLTAAYHAGLAPGEGPWVVEAWVRRGQAQLDRGQLEEAARAYQEALEIARNSTPARLGQGWIWIRQGRFADARDLASQEIEKDSEASEPYLLRACARRRIVAERAAAEDDHQQAVKFAPGQARPLAERALYVVLYLEDQRYVEGIRDVRQALVCAPNDTLALALDAYSGLQMGDRKRAKEVLDRLEADPRPYECAFAYWVRGRWIREVAEKDEVKQARELARVQHLGALRVDPWCPYANLDLGRIKADQGALPEAELHLSRGLQIMPQEMKARRKRSLVRVERKDRLGALADCDYLATHPESAADLTHAGGLRRKLGFPKLGLRLAQRALGHDSDSMDALLLRAECQVDLGRFEDARLAIPGLKRAPEQDRVHVTRSLAEAELWLSGAEERFAEGERLRSADPDLALERFREALAAKPAQVAWWIALGELEATQPALSQRAVYSATRALELDPERVEALELRGRALAAFGDARAARQDLVDFLARAPAHPRRAEASALLERLGK